MEWFIGVTIGVILIAGSVVALWWWRLASKIAPYKDELERSVLRDEKARANEGEVVVISRASTGPGGAPQSK